MIYAAPGPKRKKIWAAPALTPILFAYLVKTQNNIAQLEPPTQRKKLFGCLRFISGFVILIAIQPDIQLRSINAIIRQRCNGNYC
jgi:hypothetical protein